VPDSVEQNNSVFTPDNSKLNDTFADE